MKKGTKLSEDTKNKMSISAKKVIHKPTQGFQKGHSLLGNNPTSKGKKWKLAQETKDKMSKRMLGNKINFIEDRTKLKISEDRRLDYRYKDWVKLVKSRDKFKCALQNDECLGNLEAHHIFNWRNYKELRYVVSNGITLCHFHHPKKHKEEERMIPIFQELIFNK